MKRFIKIAGALLLVMVAMIATSFSGQQVYALSSSTSSPAQAAQTVRDTLFQAQFALLSDAGKAQKALQDAQQVYNDVLAGTLAQQAPESDKQVKKSFDNLQQALTSDDASAFAAARSDAWTSLLAGSYTVVEQALKSGDGKLAQTWLMVREFRQATRFSRPGTDATVAVDDFVAKRISASDALLSVHADLLDTYQARMNEALQDLADADKQNYSIQRAEYAALAYGYFSILAPFYREQRGDSALNQAQQAFSALRSAALSGNGVSTALAPVNSALDGFRAAPLSASERTRRAGQLLRFVSLVPVEYGRGVSGGTVTKDLELREAITFRDGAAAAFADLQDLLAKRDKAKTAQAHQLLQTLEEKLSSAANRKQVASSDEIQSTTNQLTEILKALIPPEWQQRTTSADFDVIASMLDQMIAAVAQKQYDLAESARLEAYSILETGPEARLVAFAPESVAPIEDLFWYGQGEHKGLAYQIAHKASIDEIKASRAALDEQLNQAQKSISSGGTPFSVATNAAIIVFREGLEAVLILASLLGSLKRGETRKFRRPLWVGAALAFVGTVITWALMQGILSSLARYGEMLEAIVSLIAIAVLLLITNWFFHKVYWTGWIANFHTHKRRLLSADMGQWVGLAVLGFTSIYREGFETVLFLQALVLEAGVGAVLGGIGLGLLGTLIVGLIVFALQMKLPYKKMLIVTGVMIGAVLLIMVGNTVHVLQVVGWLPIHPLGFVIFPFWTGLWMGLYATWEGILLQVASAVFVIGSYFLAERQQHKRNTGGPSAPPSAEKPKIEATAGR